jgi:hypothetical protein
LNTKALKVLILTAATSVAAVFICLLTFKNTLLYYAAKKNIESLKLENSKIQLSHPSLDELGLEILSMDSVPLLSTRWNPSWSFKNRSLQLLGRVTYPIEETTIQLDIPLSFSLNQISPIQIGLSGTYEKIKWTAKGLVNQVPQGWQGHADALVTHPEWGELSPEFHFKWGEASELLISLTPEQVKSNYLRLGQLSINAKNSTSSKWEFSGSASSIDINSEILKQLSTLHFDSVFGGALDSNTSKGFQVSLEGEIKDSLKSFSAPFSLKANEKAWALSSQVNIEIFEGSLADLLIKEQIPGARLLSGKLTGTLKRNHLQLELEPTSLLIKDYLITELTGKGLWDVKKKSLTTGTVHFGFAGGSFAIQPFNYSLKGEQTTLDFFAEGIQLKKLLSAFPKSKLSGEGLFKGKGSLILGSNDFFLSSLNLENSTPGTINYSDPSQPFFEKKVVFLNEFEDLLAQGQQALVLKALENFHYSHFQIQAQRPFADQMKLLLNLKGKNPDLAKGQLFDITLPIEGDLDSLFKGSLLQQSLNEELKKRNIETE